MTKMTRASRFSPFVLRILGASRWALAGEKLNVYTENYPLAYFAERVAGDLESVTFPAPQTVAAYQGADLILRNGADYAKWAAKASLPFSRTVDKASCSIPAPTALPRATF